jgi:glutamate synthase (NADPH/NADH) large chain
VKAEGEADGCSAAARACGREQRHGRHAAFDAERLRILVERHLLHTGSARAKALLDNWSEALTHFVKVMPTDYARALKDMKTRTITVAAE